MPDLLSFLKTLQPFLIGGAFGLLYLAEHVFPQKSHGINRPHDLKNLAVGIFNFVLVFLVGIYYQKGIVYLEAHHFGLFNLIELPFVLRIFLELLLLDLFMYWWHRANHTLRFLWKFHRFHHTDTDLNSTSALRFHTIELSLSYVARLLVFPLLGFSFLGIIIYSLVFTPVVVFHHSSVRINKKKDAFFRRFIVTPRMHRVHHSIIREETDSNFSSVFPWWDKIFGSFIKPYAEDVEFGTT